MPLWLSLLIWPVLTSAAFAVTLLPRKVELALGPGLGRLLLRFDKKRRKIARENIRRCLPELGAEGTEQLLRKNFEHYGTLALEILHVFSPIPGHYRRYAARWGKIEGLKNWLNAEAKGKGVIFTSAHVGNWEIMGAASALVGPPITMVTRHLKPEWLHKKMEAARLSTKLKCAFQPRTVPTLMKALRKGESIGFVIDQYAPPPQGVPVEFFGVKVDTLAAVAPLAQRTGAAVVPVCTYRDEKGFIRIGFEPELELGPALEDAAKTTEILAAKVESWIRANPEQWLWIHRRFKNVVWPTEKPARIS